jgi:hypothetical protein
LKSNRTERTEYRGVDRGELGEGDVGEKRKAAAGEEAGAKLRMSQGGSRHSTPPGSFDHCEYAAHSPSRQFPHVRRRIEGKAGPNRSAGRGEELPRRLKQGMIPERVTTSAVGVIHPPLRLSVCKMFPQLHLRCHAQIHASSIENDQSWFATVGESVPGDTGHLGLLEEFIFCSNRNTIHVDFILER